MVDIHVGTAADKKIQNIAFKTEKVMYVCVLLKVLYILMNSL